MGKRVAAAVGAILLVLLIIIGASGFIMLNDAREILDSVDSITSQKDTYKEAIKNGDGNLIRDTTASIASEIADIHQTTDGIAWQIGSFIPYIGHDISIGRQLVAEADTLAQNALIPASDQLAEINLSNIMVDGAINVELLQSLVDTLNDITPVIQQSSDVITSLPDPYISKIAEPVAKVKSLMGSADTMLESVNQIAPYLPAMLGADGQTRNYLITAMTNAELRGVGGFPGSAGVMSVTDGKMELGGFISPQIDLDPVAGVAGTTDAERALYPGVDTLFTSTYLEPDFPRAASKAASIWQSQRGDNLDGVIAIDPIFLQRLLKITGASITASNGMTANGDNIASLLLHDVYQSLSTEEQDAFFSSVASQAFGSIIGNLGNISLTDLVDTVTTAIQERRFQAYMVDPDEQSIMVKIGCAGSFPADEEKPQVGVYVNDNTWSKIAWYLGVNTTIGEGVKNADGTTTYACTTTLTNNLSEAEASGLDDYVTGYNPSKRSLSDMIEIVYFVAPAGGSIDAVTYTDEDGAVSTIAPVDDNGHAVFSTTAQISGGGTATFTYNVTVSANAAEPLSLDTTPTCSPASGY